jgi:hypothetical protein
MNIYTLTKYPHGLPMAVVAASTPEEASQIFPLTDAGTPIRWSRTHGAWMKGEMVFASPSTWPAPENVVVKKVGRGYIGPKETLIADDWWS